MVDDGLNETNRQVYSVVKTLDLSTPKEDADVHEQLPDWDPQVVRDSLVSLTGDYLNTKHWENDDGVTYRVIIHGIEASAPE